MWSYESQLTTPKDKVRFMIQDTTESRPLFQDEEINWLISTEANIYMAAAALCDNLVARSSGGGGGGGIKSKKVGDLTIIYNYDPTLYRSLSMMLRSRGLGHQVPYAGGISNSDKLNQQRDRDWPTPTFARGMEENPGAPKPMVTPTDPTTER